jgi:hypothetical protein
MAKQAGIIRIEGTVGNLTFVRTKDGYQVKEKTSLNGDRISADASFERTRENASEFGRAGKAGKVLRQAFRSILATAKDSKVVSRLLKELMKVIKADATSIRGLRNVIDGETELLKGFDFNLSAPLGTNFKAVYTSTIDRLSGTMGNSIEAFVPARDLAYPEGATHFKLISTGAAINFTTETFEQQAVITNELPINNTPLAAQNLNFSVAANSTDPLFLCLGIQYYQSVNGTFYPLKNTAKNCFGIVAVNGV